MFSEEQRRVAIETLIKYGYSYADTVAELGYPNRATLRLWWKEYVRTGVVPVGKGTRKSRYTDEQARRAVEHYLEHGRSLSRTMRALGYPKGRQTLCDWIDELAPGERKCRGPRAKSEPTPIEKKVQVVAELEARTGPARMVAERHGVSRTAPYIWRRELMGHNGGDDKTQEKGVPVSKEFDDLPDDVEALQDMLRAAKLQLRRVQLELDVRQATLEIVKKDPGTDPNRLTNQEKAELVDALRPRWRLREILPIVGMAKSSYEYARNARLRGESAERSAARKAIVEAFGASGGTYGYRRVQAQVNASGGMHVGEWTVRSIMEEEGLAARVAKRKRRYSSYQGEISEAPDNLLRDGRGRHDFGADRPNEKWITDVTEFRIPAGKVYLSPIVDCFDGMPLSWSISTSPDAEMANSSLVGACELLGEGEHPLIHSDRGCHYRWPGWIGICEEHGLVRSMSRKGCSPDNSRCEGFFGRLKVEWFYGRDWNGVTIDEFMGMLDAYLRWYRDVRIKSDLGYMSPIRYRESLGLAA